MLKRIREKLGAAGLVVAIIALVVAVAGTAYAATKLNATQKKEVKKIAKEFAGKDGVNGKDGAPGAKGDAGVQGVPGKDGEKGKDGKDGRSVVLKNEAPPLCPEGGYTYEVEGSSVENEVCNGKKGDKGEPWSPNNTLPSGAMETGSWAFSVPAGYGAPIYVPISLPIKLATPITEEENATHYQGEPSFATFCGGGAGAPAPVNSHELCVYKTELSNATFGGVFSAASSIAGELGRTGGYISFTPSSEAAQGWGAWAIKG